VWVVFGELRAEDRKHYEFWVGTYIHEMGVESRVICPYMVIMGEFWVGTAELPVSVTLVIQSPLLSIHLLPGRFPPDIVAVLVARLADGTCRPNVTKYRPFRVRLADGTCPVSEGESAPCARIEGEALDMPLDIFESAVG